MLFWWQLDGHIYTYILCNMKLYIYIYIYNIYIYYRYIYIYRYIYKINDKNDTYNKIHVAEGIYINEASTSRKSVICHWSYFLGKGFKFQLAVCNVYHGVLMMYMNDVNFLKIHIVDNRCIINRISRSEVVNLLQNVDLNKKVDYYFIVYKRWVKKLKRLVILKSKNVNFMILKIYLILIDIDSRYSRYYSKM